MKEIPYSVYWEGYPKGKISIELPNYFSNYKYVKVKVKDIFAKLDNFSDLFLASPLFSYDREILASNHESYHTILNLTRYFKNGTKFPSFKIPYTKEVFFTFHYSIASGGSSGTFSLSLELIPVN